MDTAFEKPERPGGHRDHLAALSVDQRMIHGQDDGMERGDV
jgi:hypothetical protein